MLIVNKEQTYKCTQFFSTIPQVPSLGIRYMIVMYFYGDRVKCVSPCYLFLNHDDFKTEHNQVRMDIYFINLIL